MTITKDVIAQAIQINPDRIRDFYQNGNVIHVFLTDSQEVLTVNIDKCKLSTEKDKQSKQTSQRRSWGVVLVVVGAISTLSAFGMDTTVSTEYSSVHNIGLIQKQNKNIQLGGIIFIAGIVLCCLGNKNNS